MLLEAACIVLATLAIVHVTDIFVHPKIKFPRVGASPTLSTWWARWSWYKRGHEQVKSTYEKAREKSYVVQTLMGDTVVLAPKFLGELNMLPEAKLSSTAALVDSVYGQYNGVDILLRDRLTYDIVRSPFTRNIPLFLPQMAEELRAVLSEKLGDSIVESPVVCTTYELLYACIHRITSLVFVGKTYCYDTIWTEAVAGLPTDVYASKFILLPFPGFLRQFVARLLPQPKRLARRRAAVRDLLFPAGATPVANEEFSVMKLLLESGKDADPDSITARLLLLTAAALHTSSMAITHALFDLLARPEYIEALRNEAQQALAAENGEWTFSTIGRLRRMDSFVKESQRWNSSLLGFDRKVMSPIELSDGKTVRSLPRATLITVPAGPMSRDPAFYDDPDQFDGFRFYRGEENGGTDSTDTQHEFAGIHPGSVAWGSGRFVSANHSSICRHDFYLNEGNLSTEYEPKKISNIQQTCPGRWYASTMIKLILANLLIDYNLSFPPGQNQRPENILADSDVLPDFGQKIVVQKRISSSP